MRRTTQAWTRRTWCRAALGAGVCGLIGCNGGGALTTHPATEERIAAMEKVLRDLERSDAPADVKPGDSRHSAPKEAN